MKKGEKRGEEKRTRKRTKRRGLKEGLLVLFLWRPSMSLVKGKIWRVVVIFLVKIFLEEPGDLSDCEPETRVEVTVVLDVTDVLVSPLFCGH